MSTLVRIRHDIRAELPADLPAVEEFIRAFRESLKFGSEKDWFETELLIREALNNAVLHGCECQPDRHVRCVLRLGRRQLIIAVVDEGKGFKWRNAMQAEAASFASSGRGVEIYAMFANRVRFNAKGNCVTMIKRFEGGTLCPIE
jgi:anti-sigma regulatory factor (Ser/Thr protein kinase)